MMLPVPRQTTSETKRESFSHVPDFKEDRKLLQLSGMMSLVPFATSRQNARSVMKELDES